VNQVPQPPLGCSYLPLQEVCVMCVYAFGPIRMFLPVFPDEGSNVVRSRRFVWLLVLGHWADCSYTNQVPNGFKLTTSALKLTHG
jgi:hypothetical protein